MGNKRRGSQNGSSLDVSVVDTTKPEEVYEALTALALQAKKLSERITELESKK